MFYLLWGRNMYHSLRVESLDGTDNLFTSDQLLSTRSRKNGCISTCPDAASHLVRVETLRGEFFFLRLMLCLLS